jgi:roadblock/LC7 domain-containing protein
MSAVSNINKGELFPFIKLRNRYDVAFWASREMLAKVCAKGNTSITEKDYFELLPLVVVGNEHNTIIISCRKVVSVVCAKVSSKRHILLFFSISLS